MTTLHAASKVVSTEIALGHCGTQTHPLGQWPEFHPEEFITAKEIRCLSLTNFSTTQQERKKKNKDAARM